MAALNRCIEDMTKEDLLAIRSICEVAVNAILNARHQNGGKLTQDQFSLVKLHNVVARDRIIHYGEIVFTEDSRKGYVSSSGRDCNDQRAATVAEVSGPIAEVKPSHPAVEPPTVADWKKAEPEHQDLDLISFHDEDHMKMVSTPTDLV